MYFYSNIPFELGEIQYTNKEHEFHETFALEKSEGFTNFENSLQFYIDFGEIGKHNDQALTIELENSSSFELKTCLSINILKRESINQRISESVMNELGLQLNPIENVFIFIINLSFLLKFLFRK